MRLAFLLGLCGIIFVGCAGNTRKASPTTESVGRQANSNKPNVIVTPGTVVSGKVSFVNAASRFVVITFPLGVMPTVERRLSVYRGGLKVAELKVSKEQIDVNSVADIMTGECQVGDEVRED